MIATTLHIGWTLVAIVFFVGIVIWAWSGKRKQDFEALANLPLEDDQAIGVRPQASENRGQTPFFPTELSADDK